jgi:NADPH:quinone reductase-like Zn-dependent oxidoreductase
VKAATLSSFDGVEAITIEDVPEPDLGPADALVRVEAASVGVWDAFSVTGALVPLGGLATFPQRLGWELAGVVEATGSEVEAPMAGTRVFGFVPQPWTGIGTLAERVSLPAGLLSVVPEGLSAKVAATLPVALLTADLTVEQATLQQWTRVLVLGAAGSVGSFVTQLAAQRGATVLASVSAADLDEVVALGASVAIDRSGDVAAAAVAAGGPVDVILDLVGSAAWPSSIRALRQGGRFITTVTAGDGVGLPPLPHHATGATIAVQPNPARLGELAERVAQGRLIARTGAEFPLSQTRQAIQAAPSAGRHRSVVLP